MNSETTVYGKPGCQGCKATVKKLEQLQVPHRYIDITVDEVAHQEVKTLGFTALPVVTSSNGKPFAGYRPDMLRKLKSD